MSLVVVIQGGTFGMDFSMVVIRVVVLQNSSYLRRYTFLMGVVNQLSEMPVTSRGTFLGGAAWIVVVPGISCLYDNYPT